MQAEIGVYEKHKIGNDHKVHADTSMLVTTISLIVTHCVAMQSADSWYHYMLVLLIRK